MSRGRMLTAMAGTALASLFAAAPIAAAAATATPTTTQETSTTTGMSATPATPATTATTPASTTSTPTTSLVNDPFAPVTPRGSATTASVSIVDFAFSPSSITVSAGTTVTWTNTGSAPHSVTSDTGAFDSSPSCPTGQCIDPGSSYSHLFAQAGTFAYHCKVHPTMTGTVVVNAAPAPSTTTTATPGTSAPSNNTSPPASSGGTPGSTASPTSSGNGGPELAFTGASIVELWLALGGVAAITLGLALRPGRRSFPDPN